MRHLLTARIRDRLVLHDYRAVGLELAPSSRSAYRYRMLFFPIHSEKPVLSFNFETSILGSSCLTEQRGGRHVNLGPSDDRLSYEEFREWALSRAERSLSRS